MKEKQDRKLDNKQVRKSGRTYETVFVGNRYRTSACKTAVFDEDGHVLATGSGDYRSIIRSRAGRSRTRRNGGAAVCGAIKAMLEKSGIRAEDIAGIGIDGQSWSAIPVDKNGEVLANTPIWMDTRAADICEEVGRKSERTGSSRYAAIPLKPPIPHPRSSGTREICRKSMRIHIKFCSPTAISHTN